MSDVKIVWLCGYRFYNFVIKKNKKTFLSNIVAVTCFYVKRGCLGFVNLWLFNENFVTVVDVHNKPSAMPYSTAIIIINYVIEEVPSITGQFSLYIFVDIN